MTLKKAGISLTMQGKAAYLAGLKSITQQTKLLEAQTKQAVAELGNNAKIVDKYKVQMNSMSKMQELASKRTESLTNLQEKLPKAIDGVKASIVEVSKAHSDSAKNTEKLKTSYDELQKSGKTLTQEMNSAKKTYDELKRSGKANSDEIKEAKTRYEELSRSVKENKSQVKDAKTAYTESKSETNAYERELKQLNNELSSHQKELNGLPMKIAKAKTATAELRNEAQRLHDEYRKNGGRLADTAKQWQDFGTRVQGVGQKLNSAGDYMTTRFTLPIVAGFGAAVKQATEFHSQIGALGPLLTNGKPINAEVAGQIQELGKSSRSLAINYGKNTAELNGGMAELIRNGFTAQQVLGMMPNLLDASIASNEDFNDVMRVSSQVLNQFKLRGKDYAETLKNTQRVTDSLTFVGNATSAGFRDLGEGMAYVGPVAKSLNMSVEETASLLGILSDNGIEASQGGTALRGALTRLLKPSKQNTRAFEELGISTEAFRNGTLKLPEILDKIKKNTKDWTDEQRAAALATAFGTEAQTAMNALVSVGGDELRKLTKEAENASGATKQIADAMKELPEFKFKQMQAKIKDLGIELGSKLLPHVLKAMEHIGKWVDSFSKLDPKMQDFIVKAGLATAAIGPLLKTLGTFTTGAGTVAKGVGGLIKLYGTLTTSSVALGGKTSLLTGLLGGLNLPLVALGATIVAGYGAWKIWGEESYNAAQRAKEFPDISGITEKQAESLRSMRDEVAGLGAEMDVLNTTTDFSTVNANISSLGSEIKTLNDEKIAKLREDFSKLPKDVQEGLQGALESAVATIEAQTQQAEEAINRINEIQKVGLDKNGVLKAEYVQEMKILNDELLTYYSKSLGENAEQQKQIYATLSADLNSMTYKQLEERVGYYENIRAKETDLYKQQQDVLYSMWKQDAITREQYDTQMERIKAAHTSRLTAIDREYIQSAIAMFEKGMMDSEGHIDRNSERYKSSLQTFLQELGYTYEEAMALINSTDLTTPVKNMIEYSKDASSELKGAVGDWTTEINKFAESLGDGRTASQLTNEELKQFIDTVGTTSLSWSDLKLLTKEAKVDDNLKELINKEAEARGGWDKLLFEEKNADVKMRVFGAEEVQAILEKMGEWDSLTPEEKELVANVDNPEDAENLIHQLIDWNTMSIEDKILNLEAQVASDNLLEVIRNRDLWNNSEFYAQFIALDTNAPDAQEKIAQLVSEYTGMPIEEIKELITSTNAEETERKVSQLKQSADSADGKNVNVNVTDNNSALTSLDNLNKYVASAAATDGRSIDTYLHANNAQTAISEVNELGATADANNNKSVSITSNLVGMIANLVTIGLYKAATDSLADKSVTATTNVPSMASNKSQIDAYNKSSSAMKNTRAVASTSAPNIHSHISGVNSWNSATRNMSNRSSSASTSAPGIHSNTNAVWGWIRALNSLYNRSSTITTYVDKVYRTFGKHSYATGGHIGMFASGGHIPMFANGGNVPVGYTGIVGEAGPEIFQVTKKGVSITPLSTREKMKGFGKVMEEYGGGKGGSQTVQINITINGGEYKDESNQRSLAMRIREEIEKIDRRKSRARGETRWA
ncbi:phage tail tape measure protein [Aerococcaceae bacterium NML160702]|nr:phage tail tape measure protein [Aerococcaceae bacterium NML190073]MCW6681543.1 phage tail tape measure protein [Aerococcaceae bacterium NML160702]